VQLQQASTAATAGDINDGSTDSIPSQLEHFPSCSEGLQGSMPASEDAIHTIAYWRNEETFPFNL
jgi:hypothetical protein